MAKGQNKTKRDALRQTAQKASRPLLSRKVTFPEPETGDKPLKNMKLDRAALLVAQDELSDKSIALLVGIVRSTLAVWKNQPAFQARVGYFREELSKQALKDVIEQGRARAANQDSDVRQFYAQAAARAVSDDAMRQLEEMHDRGPAATARPFAIAPAHYVEPERPQNVWDVLLKPQREPMCLNSDPMHSSWGH